MRTRRTYAIPLTLIGALAAAALLAASRPPPEAPQTPPPGSEDAAPRMEDTASGASGLRIHLDPETGEMRNRPIEPEAAGEVGDPGDRFNTYGGDLFQEALPNGGFKVDLRGRFRSSVVATIDPETGELKIDCLAEPPAREANDDE